MHSSSRILTPIAGALFLLPASGQVASRVLNQGDVLPGAKAQNVDWIYGVQGNSQGGYVIHLVTDGFPGQHVAWGSASGGVPGVLHAQGSHSGVQQSLWRDGGVAIDNMGEVVYASLTLPQFNDALWKDGSLIAEEYVNTALVGWSWERFAQMSVAAETGEPFFVAQLEEYVATGLPDKTGLFLGTGGLPLSMTGDVYPPYASPVNSDPFDPDGFDVSPDGSSWIATPHLEDGSELLVLDGGPHSIQGFGIRTSTQLPPRFGPGHWTSLRDPQVNNAGDVAFIGHAGSTALVVRNGEVVHCTGDVIDGEVVQDFRHLSMNARGRLAYQALLEDGTWALGIENTLVLRTGDPVDLDNNLSPEPGTEVRSFGDGGYGSRPFLGDDDVVRFVIEVDTLGTPADPSDDVCGVYRLDFDARGPNTYCTATKTRGGCEPMITWKGKPSASGATFFDITARHLPAGTVGTLGYSVHGSNATPFKGGTLCIQPPMRRTPGTQVLGIGSHGCVGVLGVDFRDHLMSGADPALAPGTQVHAQWFFRDPGAASGMGFTNAIEFVVRP